MPWAVNASAMRILLSVLLAASLSAFAQNVPLQNWPVAVSRTNALAFVAVTPCRLVDTRNPSGPFGGPVYAALETRTYDIAAGGCPGLPLSAQAYSLNLTILNYNVGSGSYVTAWPAGTSRPNVSSVNFGTGVPVANASVVATGSSGQISVFAGGSTDILIDLNGYFIGGAGTLPSGKNFRMTGSIDDSGVIYGINASSTSGIYTTGVLGTVTSLTLTDGSGVMGYATSGVAYGVKGLNSGTTAKSAGVLGISGARSGEAIGNLAGVRGESQLGFGVLGNTNNAAGVGGTFNDANGNILRSGYLANSVYAVYAAGDIGASGTKFFVEPHPTDASKVIRFIALEGPEAGTYFRGRGRFVRGHAIIDVPESFRMTSEEEGMTVHLTPIGGLAMVAVTRQSLDRIEAEASKDVEFAYVVYGVRRGYKGFQPIRDGVEFIPENASSKLPGYLNDDQKQRLIDNGTYNSDGTVNIGTAVRLGWDKAWKEK
jgi:hypothetical protein